jgi:hypothetical protein
MKRIAGVILALLIAAACEESTPIPTEVSSNAAQRVDPPTHGASKSISTGTQTAPADAPPEFQAATWLDVSADAGWVSPTIAYGEGILTYFASNAELDVSLVVRNPQGTVVGSNSARATDSHFLPASRSLNRTTNVYVSQTCGLVAQATANGVAYDALITSTQQYLSWGKKSESATDGAPQGACPVTTQPTGSGTYPSPTGPMTYPYIYEISTVKPAQWQCTVYNMGTQYEQWYCVYYPATYGSRAPSQGMTLASRSALSPATLHASNAPAMPSVFVIVSNRVPANALAVIERHQRGPFKNVILVPSKDIRPAVFAAAMEALYQSRAKEGEAPAKDITLELHGTIQDAEVPSSIRDYASSFTSLIANAKPAFADSYGTTQIVEIRMRGNR